MADSFENLKKRIEENKKSKTAESADFLKEHFNLSDDEFIKLLKKFPGIVSNSKQTLKERIDSYTKLLGLENQPEIFREVYLKYPIMLALPESNFHDKHRLYAINFGIDLDKLKYIIVQNPQLLGECNDTIVLKAREYIKGLNIASFQFGKMINKNSRILVYSQDSIADKCKKVVEFGLVKEFIEDPNMFATPAESFKIRYMLSKICEDKALNLLIQNEFKSLARLKYIIEYNEMNTQLRNIPLSAVYTTEKRFVRRTGVSSSQLMADKRYQVNDELLEKTEEMYNGILDTDNAHRLTFTDEERKMLLENRVNLSTKKPKI